MPEDILARVILYGNLETLSNDRLNVICANALIDSSQAINECLDPLRVRLSLISPDRDQKVDGLYKIRGSLKERMHCSKRLADGRPARKRSHRELKQLRRVVITG